MVANLVQSNVETDQLSDSSWRAAELRDSSTKISAAVKTPLSVRIVLCAMTIALIASVSAGTALLFDGCNYLVHVVNYSHPVMPYYRYALALVHYPTIWTAELLGQLEPATVVFCSLFSLGPLLSVLLSWLTVRAAKPALFVWAMFGIALTGIFAQLYRIGENLLVCELAWPLLLGVLVPTSARRGAVVVALGIWMVNLHPVSVVFLSGVAVVAVLQAFFAEKNGTRKDAKIFLNVASMLVLLVVMRMTIAPPSSSSYEMKELSTDRLSEHFAAIQHAGLFLFGITSLVPGLCLLLSTWVKNKILTRVFCVVAFALTTVTGLYAVLWSSHFEAWVTSWSYLRFLAMLLIPLLMFATIDSFKSNQLNGFRSGLSVLCALLFVTTACVQSFVLISKTNQLKKVISESPVKVLDRKLHSICHRTPFDNWSIPAYSILVQGRNPEKIILNHEQVVEARTLGVIRLARWEKPAKDGFFHFPDTREVVSVEYSTLRK